MRRVFTFLGVLAVMTSASDAAPIDKVKEFLEAKKATAGMLTPLADEALAKTVPGQAFFGLYFRQFPVARQTPEGFGDSNVLVSDGKEKVTLLPAKKDLEAYARATFLARDDAGAKLAAKAWLLLSSEMAQDGFYKFQVVDESLTAKKDGDKLVASGRLVVMQGGNGELSVQLTFDAAGSLKEVKETAKIIAGPRPICQASKLLDPDPLVRQICQADLLIMGRAARDYLTEQRAKSSPALQAEIDRVWRRIEAGER